MTAADCVAKLADKKAALEGVQGFEELFDKADAKARISLYSHVPKLMEACGDKQKPVAQAATAFVKKMYAECLAWSGGYVLPFLKDSLSPKAKPEVKVVACDIVAAFAQKHPQSMALEIEWCVHLLSILMNDIKKDVKDKATTAMNHVSQCSGNKDLEKFTETIVKAQQSAKNVPECVEELAGCIFVQNVEGPALAVITPVLVRGLSERADVVKRRCCVIVDNMCKLIDDPREGTPLMAEVRSLVAKATESISDPDAREMSEKANASILKLVDAGPYVEQDVKAFAAKAGLPLDSLDAEQVVYCSKAAYQLVKAKKPAQAGAAFEVFGFDAAASMSMVESMSNAGAADEVEFVDDDVDAPDLYKGSFSLAYGTITLLRETKLHLKKNKFYGLLGPTNCGKTTLMRAISREMVEGFPKRDELITIFVTHDVEEREIEPPSKEWPTGKLNIDLNGWQFVVDTCNNIYKKEPPVTEELVIKTLGEIGFKNKEKKVNMTAAADMTNPITTYSGGWKVKMQLACAQLINADILMIDDPTGHLDVKNIQWVKHWLGNFPGSIIATSANTQFLNEMCTHIVDFHERKLRQFKGEKGKVLAQFVETYPEKASYFELSDKNEQWIFPVPGGLEGVKSRSKTILKMQDVTFKYPTHEKNTVENITLTVCMASRVAVVGANGAGKSTAIKLLIGELKPEKGTIWRHQNMRLAYVAQHAFHHLERHMEKTAVDYILWRFAGADDRESLENQSKEVTDDDEKLREVAWWICPKTLDVKKCATDDTKEAKAERAARVFPEAILNRQKHTKTKKYIYEVKWQHKAMECNTWVERDTLLAMGYSKLVNKKDEQEAAAAGLLTKPLTQPGVEKALKDFGLDSESASHQPLASLSHGQRVKVVICAACWQNPHIVILDEPTNYLDRDGLGALVQGLEAFKGGVVIISHNQEFTDSVCTQKWIMEKSEQTGAGRLREEGTIKLDEGEIEEVQGPDEVYDESGNKIDVKKAKPMEAKDVKKAIKEVEKKLKDNKKKNNLSEEEAWELQDKLAELQSALDGQKK
jgi:elongation factor 3